MMVELTICGVLCGVRVNGIGGFFSTYTEPDAKLAGCLTLMADKGLDVDESLCVELARGNTCALCSAFFVFSVLCCSCELGMPERCLREAT